MEIRFSIISMLINAILFLILTFPAESLAQDPLKLGLPPYVSATELFKRFSPLADQISKGLGRPVKLLCETDYESHVNKLNKGKVDIAFLGPASYVSYTKRFGAVPLLASFETNSSKTYKGFIVVKKDSPITRLSQLKGKSVAFGDVESTMGHIVPRYMLLKAGIDLGQLSRHKFMDNHENIAMAVLAGDFDAGAIRESIYNTYAREGLRALAMSEPISDHVFVARAGLPADTVKKITQILFSLKDSEEGRRSLGALQKNLTALVPVQDADFDRMRKITHYLENAGVKL